MQLNCNLNGDLYNFQILLMRGAMIANLYLILCDRNLDIELNMDDQIFYCSFLEELLSSLNCNISKRKTGIH